MREVQGVAVRLYTLWPDFYRDPIRGYHRARDQSTNVSLTFRGSDAHALSADVAVAPLCRGLTLSNGRHRDSPPPPACMQILIGRRALAQKEQ
jgi:hypothetical protein